MNPIEWSLDILLAVSLAGVAVGVLVVRDLFRAIVLFIAFGLLMALAWTRLAAPDVALAEAAIGAGLLGVLLLDALRFIQRFTHVRTSENDDELEIRKDENSR
jgi:energy-converting hydrogenase B subunit D